ncbi:hypothetical protein HanRHA438_Chr14g0667321 [Helianthus annuus]|nr:hypothetical protein HanHA300_Chr14g0534751 [Helianthus annuus]KAJ0854872.1 hypothetical protein HanRHA438_Chr14g0667321 [Helianthus annuus]
MPRSHGGDGAEDPPPPSGFGRGQHVEDLIPAKRKRGKAKNKGLRQTIALNKGPVSLPFDTEVTYSPIGIPNDWFTREVGSYMFGHFAFDKSSYNYVSDAEKNAMEVHLRVNILFKYISMFFVHDSFST